MIDREELLARVRVLPTLPATATRLLMILGAAATSAAQIEEVIRKDPALTANILRLANAAAFGRGAVISSIRQASTRLGLRRLGDLAIGLSVAAVVPAQLPGYGMSAGGFFLHCAATGVLAERLDQARPQHAGELAFTAGLLHDAGKLVIGAYLAGAEEDVRAHLAPGGMPFVAAERALLGLDHAEAGALVADRWNLPAALARVMRWHHTPAAAPPADDDGLLALVHVADGLAHSLGLGADVGELARVLDPQALASLGLSAAAVETAASESLEEIDALAHAEPASGAPR